MNRGRIEALTDGIVAIAATIMVLELGMPKEPTLIGLWEQRHTFLAYVISFFLIYVAWQGHHMLFQQVEKISPKIFFINGIWVFFLTLSPFTTAWIGTNPSEVVPAMVYTINIFLCTSAFNWLERNMMKENTDIDHKFNVMVVKGAGRAISYLIYLVCALAAYFYPILVLPIIGIMTIFLAVRVLVITKKKVQ